jgi:hypothetical protein
MKTKHYLLGYLLIGALVWGNAYAQGFPSSPAQWGLPIGGLRDGGTHFGYYNVSGSASYSHDNGSETWNLIDITGDGLPDKVVTAQTYSATQQVRNFSPGSNPYWKVYINNGSGFATSPTNWSLPIGGLRDGGTHFGYYNISGTSSYSHDNGSETWSLMDMDGDLRPDLVVTAQTYSATQQVRNFSPGSNPYWKVYFNNGNGFATSPTNWVLPIGGSRHSGTHFGYWSTSGTASYSSDNGSETWTLTDIDGDALPDLVVTSQTYSATQQVRNFSPGSNPYWKVYFNNGNGFATSATNWSLPIGGSRHSGTHFGYWNTSGTTSYSSDNGSETWSLTDLDGDALPDLVVTAQTYSATQQVRNFSPGSNPYWKFFRNNGTGFATSAVNWGLPIGGIRSGGTHFGYYNVYGSSSYSHDNGSETWSLTDLDGDAKPDLVVTAQTYSATQQVKNFSPGSNPYWKWFRNDGSRFELPYISWSLPIGGYRDGGTHFGFYNTAGNASYSNDNGSETWTIVDMNNDQQPDLVVTSQTYSATQQVRNFSPGASPYWKVYIAPTIVAVDESPSNGFVIAPNPAHETMRIIATNTQDAAQPFEIYSMNGHVVLSGNLEAVATELNISTLANGVYFVRILGDVNRTYRFVKQ